MRSLTQVSLFPLYPTTTLDLRTFLLLLKTRHNPTSSYSLFVEQMFPERNGDDKKPSSRIFTLRIHFAWCSLRRCRFPFQLMFEPDSESSTGQGTKSRTEIPQSTLIRSKIITRVPGRREGSLKPVDTFRKGRKTIYKNFFICTILRFKTSWTGTADNMLKNMYEIKDLILLQLVNLCPFDTSLHSCVFLVILKKSYYSRRSII